MLAAETDRRAPAIIEGVEDFAKGGRSSSEGVESLRVEAHGLKGAALVVGEKRLAELARRIEIAFAARRSEGTIDVDLAATLIAAVTALREGAQAAADGTTEPPSVGESIATLGD
jgi:HPt (histidine-containing phosphotransfer) domain-containing protein